MNEGTEVRFEASPGSHSSCANIHMPVSNHRDMVDLDMQPVTCPHLPPGYVPLLPAETGKMLSPTSGDAELRLTESQSRTEFWLKSKERKTVGSRRADDSRPRHTWQVAAMNISSTVTATNGTNLLLENCRSSVSCRWEGFGHHETTGIFQNSQKTKHRIWAVVYLRPNRWCGVEEI